MSVLETIGGKLTSGKYTKQTNATKKLMQTSQCQTNFAVYPWLGQMSFTFGLIRFLLDISAMQVDALFGWLFFLEDIMS